MNWNKLSNLLFPFSSKNLIKNNNIMNDIIDTITSQIVYLNWFVLFCIAWNEVLKPTKKNQNVWLKRSKNYINRNETIPYWSLTFKIIKIIMNRLIVTEKKYDSSVVLKWIRLSATKFTIVYCTETKFKAILFIAPFYNLYIFTNKSFSFVLSNRFFALSTL